MLCQSYSFYSGRVSTTCMAGTCIRCDMVMPTVIKVIHLAALRSALKIYIDL